MRTLYVSDLDGTLLRSDETLSTYTCGIINELVDKGLLFSYATARSYNTAKKVTQGLNVNIPIIVYNGVSIRNSMTGEILISHSFDCIDEVIHDFIKHDMMPIVYSYIDGVEKFSYVEDRMNLESMNFIHTRANDPRNNPIHNIEQLYLGDIFYLTFIDDAYKLEMMYQKYQQQYHCIYSKDIYSSSTWLEITPPNTSKAQAVQQLKEYLQCNRVVVFGDGINDIEMFNEADACYAVENADDELKNRATGIIPSHNEDGVARWLKRNSD